MKSKIEDVLKTPMTDDYLQKNPDTPESAAYSIRTLEKLYNIELRYHNVYIEKFAAVDAIMDAVKELFDSRDRKYGDLVNPYAMQFLALKMKAYIDVHNKHYKDFIALQEAREEMAAENKRRRGEQ